MLTDEQEEYIVEIYSILKEQKKRIPYISEGIACFKDQFGFEISKNTIKLRWKSLGKLGTAGGANNGLGDDRFLELFNIYNSDLDNLLNETGYSIQYLIKKCKKCKCSLDKQVVKEYKRTHHRIKDVQLTKEKIKYGNVFGF